MVLRNIIAVYFDSRCRNINTVWEKQRIYIAVRLAGLLVVTFVFDNINRVVAVVILFN
jgi:hypothetical protein